MIRASAPGKLMLCGEHAVVHDRPCIVTAVDLRYTAELALTDAPAKIIRIDAPGLPGSPVEIPLDAIGTSARKETAFVEAVIARMHRLHPLPSGISIKTSGPAVSYGLGSSSAITVAAAFALAELLELSLTHNELYHLCYGAVLDVQGTGSGFDIAAAINGGTLYFSGRGRVIEPLTVTHLPIIIGFSGSKVGTVNLVNHVSTLLHDHPTVVEPLFDSMQMVVEQAKIALLSADWQIFGTLCDINQGLLDALGVNTLRLSELVFAARGAGALGAKLSGAGGGDCMFALAIDEQDAIRTAIEKAGGQVLDLATGVSGVRID